MIRDRAPVVGVLGGSGGVGASTFAAVLAAVAGGALLVDLDVLGGGIDVRLGIESVPGARWSGLRLAGGRLDPETLLAGVPRWRDSAVLAADVHSLDASAVEQVLDAAEEAEALDAVVLDLARYASPARSAALARCDLVVVVAVGEVPALVAAHAVHASLPEVARGVAVRRGEVGEARAATLVGAPLVGRLPPMHGTLRLDTRRLPRSLARVAAGVLSGLRVPARGRRVGTRG